MPEQRKAEAQQALDELFSKHLLPFKLSARIVGEVGVAEYIVNFHDSRLHSVAFSCRAGECFKDVFRAAVLERVSRLSGHPERLAAA